MSTAYESPTRLLHWPVLFVWVFFFFLKDTRGHYLWASRKQITLSSPFADSHTYYPKSHRSPSVLPLTEELCWACRQPLGEWAHAFLDNSLGSLDIVRISAGTAQMPQLFWRSAADRHPECLGWQTLRISPWMFTELLILTCLRGEGKAWTWTHIPHTPNLPRGPPLQTPPGSNYPLIESLCKV